MKIHDNYFKRCGEISRLIDDFYCNVATINKIYEIQQKRKHTKFINQFSLIEDFFENNEIIQMS